jgi:hypothetical protein
LWRRQFNAEAGAIALNGQPAGQSFTRRIISDAGSFSLIGMSAEPFLFRSPSLARIVYPELFARMAYIDFGSRTALVLAPSRVERA